MHMCSLTLLPALHRSVFLYHLTPCGCSINALEMIGNSFSATLALIPTIVAPAASSLEHAPWDSHHGYHTIGSITEKRVSGQTSLGCGHCGVDETVWGKMG